MMCTFNTSLYLRCWFIIATFFQAFATARSLPHAEYPGGYKSSALVRRTTKSHSRLQPGPSKAEGVTAVPTTTDGSTSLAGRRKSDGEQSDQDFNALRTSIIEKSTTAPFRATSESDTGRLGGQSMKTGEEGAYRVKFPTENDSFKSDLSVPSKNVDFTAPYVIFQGGRV